VNSLPETVTRQRRGCDLNPGPTAPESSRPTIRLPSHSFYTLVRVRVIVIKVMKRISLMIIGLLARW